MVSKVLLLLLLSISMTGWGAGIWSLAQKVGRFGGSSPGFGVMGLLGLCTVASLATLANFFQEINLSFSVITLVLGVSLAFYIPLARGWLTSIRKIAPVILIVLVFALIAITTEPGHDAGLYHLPHQYWLRTDKIVFGLANLHSRFGFNSILEPLLATAWLPGPDLTLVQLTTILFNAFFFLVLLDEGANANSPLIGYFSVAAALGFYFMQEYGGLYWASNYDIPAAVCVVLCVLFCLKSATDLNDNSGIVLAFFFAAFATAIKLTSAPVWILVGGASLARMREGGLRSVPILPLLLIGVVFVPWLLRGVVLSGCFAYPVSATCIDTLYWSAKAAAINDTQWITAWSRAPRSGLVSLGNWGWLPTWYERHRSFLASILIIGVSSFGVAYLLAPSRVYSIDKKRAHSRKLLLALALTTYATIAVAFWFLKMPDPRYGIGHIFIGALLLSLVWLVFSDGLRWPQVIRVFPLIICLVPAAIFAERLWKHAYVYSQYPLIAYQSLKIPPVAVKKAEFGTRPIADNSCWLTPPPCAPNYGLSPSFKSTQFGPYRLFSVKP